MPTKSRPFVKVALAVALLAGGAIVARASSSPIPMEPEFRAAYPHTPITGSKLAGVAIDKISLPGFRLVEREDRAFDDGGVTLSYADANDHVRVVLTLAVAPSEEAARKVVDVALHGVQTTLPRATDPAMGDYAFADDGGRGEALVIASTGNVAWSARVDRDAPSVPRASEAITALRAFAVPGTPSFPTVGLALPTDVRMGGAAVAVTAPAGLTPKLRAEGAYIAHGKGSPLVRPFAAGSIAVVATVVDELGRVGTARATATAR